MKSFGWIVMSSLVVFLMATSTSWAQAGGPRLTCDEGSVGSCIGDMLDEQSSLMDEVDGLLDDMAAAGIFSFGRDQFGLGTQEIEIEEDLRERMAKLRNANGRAGETNAAITDEEYDEMLEQGDRGTGKQQCKLSDIPFFESLGGEDPPGLMPLGSQFGDGKCNIFTAMDEDGKTVRVNERKENMCERVCEVKGKGKPEDQTGKSKGRFIGSMQDAISSVSVARQSISLQRANIDGLGVLLSGLRLSATDFSSSQTGDACDPGEPGPGADLIAEAVLQGIIAFNDVLIVLSDGVVVVTGGIAAGMKVATNHTFAGFNASTAALPMTVTHHSFRGVSLVLKAIKTGLGDAKAGVSIAAKFVRSLKADKAKACSKLINDEFDGPDGAIFTLQADVDILKAATTALQGDAAQTTADVAAIKAEVALIKSLLEETRDLLLTPAGLRPGFSK